MVVWIAASYPTHLKCLYWLALDSISFWFAKHNPHTWVRSLPQLDEGIGNITSAANANGFADSITYVFTTDNGGPAQGFNGNMVSFYKERAHNQLCYRRCC